MVIATITTTTNTGPTTIPTTDADLLKLVQWLSPAFPVGGYAYSHGLEAAISEGRVSDAATLQQWLATVLGHGSGRADAVLLCVAMAPDADHAALAELAAALAASSERWTETIDQGHAFTEAQNALSGNAFSPAPLPVAVGRAAAALALPAERVAALYLHAFASTLVSGAVRFIPLGQTDGQRVLAALHPLIEAVAQEAAQTDPDHIATSAFGADLAAMRHEGLEVRIFRT
ncbi:urease accessory protein UreF [Palleronia sp. KMU-117]|uniref:urease accessory protein UreF n=1 Tax=Palleronia sp. KMU-117 TaxID=3434108 RepID=UPI003D72F74C